MDFLIPYVTEIPQKELRALELGHQETPSPLNPIGVKGAGEAGVIPVSALIASAVEDAVGFPIDSMPLSPNDLYYLKKRFDAGELPKVDRFAGVSTAAKRSTTKAAGTKKRAAAAS
jgi:hypothetical protein